MQFSQAMEVLPSELLRMILPYLRGVDFISFRQVCMRFKNIADDLEISGRPALWRQYVLHDYPRSCLESAAPWLYVEDINDPVIWKDLYVNLRESSFLQGTPLKFTHLLFDTRNAQMLCDVKFFYNHLLTIDMAQQVSLVRVRKEKWQWPSSRYFGGVADENACGEVPLLSAPVVKLLHNTGAVKLLKADKSSRLVLLVQGSTRALPMPWLFQLSFLQPEFDNGNKGAGISVWTNCVLCFRKLYTFGEKELSISSYGTEGDFTTRKVRLQTEIERLTALTFNGNVIIAVGEKNTLYLIPNISDSPAPVFLCPLAENVLKIKVLGNLVIMLFDDGKLETARVTTDDSNRLHLTDRRVLIDENRKYGMIVQSIFSIMDFAVHGQILAAVTGNGRLFLSHMDSLDQESLEKNLHSPYTVPLKYESSGSYISRMTMDIEDGLKIAFMEIYFDCEFRTCLHVVYVDRESWHH